MSTFLKSQTLHPIRSTDDLKCYFHKHAKLPQDRKIGLECELLAVNRQTAQALPYQGPQGIEVILNKIAKLFSYTPIKENRHTIALKKGSNLISLEPGGQIELSAEPVKSVHQIVCQLDRFFEELRAVREKIPNVTFLAYGIQPVSKNKNISWVPKERYRIMAHFLGKRGKLAHDMMKRTASNQVNVDYTSEQDAFEQMCLVMHLTSIVSAMFSNSSFSGGKPNSFLSERLAIWQHTDPARSGLLLDAFCEEAQFESYLHYLLELPLMFIVRNQKWFAVNRLTFRQFLKNGWKGTKPMLEDFELHMSTAFPEARFRQYLEIRGADGQPTHLIPAVAAFWKGLLYDEKARKAARELVKSWTRQDHLRVYQEIPIKGLKVKVKGHRLSELAQDLVQISKRGLGRQALFNTQEEDEQTYLDPLSQDLTVAQKSPAEQVLDYWKNTAKKSLPKLIHYLEI